MFLTISTSVFSMQRSAYQQALDQELFDLTYKVAYLVRTTGNELLATPCYELMQQLLQDGASPYYIGTMIVSARTSTFGPDSYAPSETIKHMTADLLVGPIKAFINQRCQKIK